MQVIERNEQGKIREVILTKAEMAARHEWDQWLDLGYGVPDAVKKSQEHHPNLDPEFWAWLGR